MPVAGGSPPHVCPNGSLPQAHLIPCEHGQRLLDHRSGAVLATLPEKQNVLDVVLDDRARLVRLTVESRAVAFGLHHTVGDLVPENRREAVQANPPRPHLDIGVQGHYPVPPVKPARNANVADNAADPATSHQYAGTFLPDLVEFIKEVFIVRNVPHLPGVLRILLQSPVGR